MSTLSSKSLTILFVFCGLGGCSTVTEPVCGAGDSYTLSGATYCYASSAIVIETGFECPGEIPNRFEGPDGVICAPDGVPMEDLPKELCDKAGDESCVDLMFVPRVDSTPSDASMLDVPRNALVRNCGVEGYSGHYGSCEEDGSETYLVPEGGRCLELCDDGQCSDGKTCETTTARSCGDGTCGPCETGIRVCVHTLELSSNSDVDGNGVVFWIDDTEPGSRRENYRGVLFEATSGTYLLRLAGHPNGLGRDTAFGPYMRARLLVMDPDVYDLHSWPPESEPVPVSEQDAVDQLASANPDAFASSCPYYILHKEAAHNLGSDSDPAAWLRDFPLGYSCARLGTPIEGQETFEPVDCSEMTLSQGPCQ